MAGLAAALNATDRIDRIAAALAPRGSDGAVCRLQDDSGTTLEVAVRSVIPVVGRVADDSGEAVAAIAVDGIASLSALDAAYAERGPRGLLDGEETYAVVVADRAQGLLVLARTAGAPGLYYAPCGEGWLAASEPEALLRAGLPAEPDVDALADFVEHGVVDRGERTCYAGIRRVPAGVAVVLGASAGTVTYGRPLPAVHPEPLPVALDRALSGGRAGGRVGVLLGPGESGAAVLGTALGRPDRSRPLPVYTATFPDLEGPASHTPAVLVPLPHGTVRPTGLTFDAGTLDVDGFLADVGEPVADVARILSWAVARRVDGAVDTLVDCLDSDPAALARVSDRVQARYGVTIRSPLAVVHGGQPDDRVTIDSIVERTLPSPVARYARTDSAGLIGPEELVRARLSEVAAAVVADRPWTEHRQLVEDLGRLHRGEAVDAGRLLRAYLVERWLRTLPAPDAAPEEAPPIDVHHAGTDWACLPVRTGPMAAGEPVVRLAAAAVADRLTALTDQRGFAEVLERGWFAVLSGKALAVGQRRISPLWEIKPGPLARVLSRLARSREPRLAEPWTVAVALAECGLFHVTLGVLALYRPNWWPGRGRTRVDDLPFVPRPGAAAPAASAVVSRPGAPQEAATAFLEALRYHVAPNVFTTLAGVAVASVDNGHVRLFAYADGPSATPAGEAERLLGELLAVDPAGGGEAHTPVVLICEAPRPAVTTDRRRSRDFAALDADRRPQSPSPSPSPSSPSPSETVA